jgi:hypothetical protein
MKLRGLVTNFYMHVSGSDLYIPTVGLIWNLYFPVLHKITLNHRSGEKGRELLPSSGWRQFPALPSAPRVQPRVHINDQRTNMDHKWKQLILVVNFLFGLRVNEIPNKKFILDSLAVYGGSERDGTPT